MLLRIYKKSAIIKAIKEVMQEYSAAHATKKGGAPLAKRKELRPANDKKVFARTANKTKKVNIKPKVMRGGTRL